MLRLSFGRETGYALHQHVHEISALDSMHLPLLGSSFRLRYSRFVFAQ